MIRQLRDNPEHKFRAGYLEGKNTCGINADSGLFVRTLSMPTIKHHLLALIGLEIQQRITPMDMPRMFTSYDSIFLVPGPQSCVLVEALSESSAEII